MEIYANKNGLKIDVKRKYAYHYNQAGSVVGRTNIEDDSDLYYFVELLFKCGFERIEE